MPEIAKCPFCGGEAELWDNSICEPIIDENGAYVDMQINSPDVFGVECTRCCCQNIGYNTEAEAKAAWNRRAQSDGCEWCNDLGKYKGFGYAEHFHQIAADECIEQSIPVKFCPNCGKRLGE